MPRPKRICPAGEVFHVLNRSVARMTLFEKPDDYDAFLRVLEETWDRLPIPIFAMIVMPNHWHFVVRPTSDDQVSQFFRLLTVTHTMRWHAHYHTEGSGHLYQGRFKSFPVQSDEHLLKVIRYVERNPLRAKMVTGAEQWKWSSAWTRHQRSSTTSRWLALLTDPPLPRRWREWVNQPQSEAEIKAIRTCIRRGSPFGSEVWTRNSVVRLGLDSTQRPRGRPKKDS